MWRMCVRTVLVETTSSDAISDAVRLLGRYLTTRSSASLSSIAQRRGRSALRRGAPGQRVEDRRDQRRVGGPVLRVALEQLAARPEHEGQDQALGLGELERRLERLLRRAPVAETIAGRGVEQQRLDARPALVQRRRRAVDDRRQRLDGLFRVVLFELQSRERDAHPGALALFRAQAGERELRGVRVAHPHPYLESPAAHVDREHVLARRAAVPGPARARTPPGLRRSGPRRSAACRGRDGARPRSPGRLPRAATPPRERDGARLRRSAPSARAPCRPSRTRRSSSTGWSSRAPRRSRVPARSARARRGSGCPVSGAAIARCARQPTSMNGREIRRVRPRASSRCCRASSGRGRPTAPRCRGS